MRPHPKERGHDAPGSNFAARPGAALSVRGKIESLASGVFLHLSAANRTRVLVAMVFLDRRRSWWWTNFKNVASMGRTYLLFCCNANVPDVGAANESGTSR